MSVPSKEVAKLGRSLIGAKKHKHRYIYLDLSVADVLHKYLASQVKAQYQKEYRKL